ncbi:DDE_Tnp_IS1595 domain-containing protein [Caerostris darwini]|uniref:DDE_Tnp_IS1595 domain-containing protein n=1 Tax=Caerostris darwini TaxID=1538125 RepID=A0AAV4PNH6_9ARAC|nr:DDE_Tnp_IS1595 domain-containing protein [Caerostris darwini]
MNWRQIRNEPTISSESVGDFYSYFREIAEVFASHHSKQLGGPDKTILLDETFLTKRKYNRGRITESMTQTVFGIFCKQDREGLFFLVDGKKKRDLWPLVKKYVHPETAVICTDEAGQYKKIDQLIKGVVHKTTNHSKGEFVDKNDKNNTINPLENENKHLKKAIVYRKTQKMLRQYMATHYYRRTRLDHMGKKNLGAKIWQFIQDVKEVYPGCLKSGLEMIQIDKVLPEDVGIEHLMPNHKNYDDSEVAEWSDLEEDGMEDDVLDLDWEEIITRPAKKIRTDEGL